MVKICFYCHVHQPWRVKKYNFFDIGEDPHYWDNEKNEHIAKRASRKCYIPTNKVLKRLIEAYPDTFHVNFSITGTAIDQLERYAPEALQSFKELAETGNVEFVGETYYHSLAYLEDKEEFNRQVRMQEKKLQETFGQTPRVFRNTELILNNEISHHVKNLGYNAILGEGADRILNGKSPNHVYKSTYGDEIPLLLRNYNFSDDIAFRFSNKGWKHYPLHADKFASWINNVNGSGELVNLFMDYETFGEHQWEESGIFEFLEQTIHHLLQHPDNEFVTVSDAAKLPIRGEVDIHSYTSWADEERNLDAWVGNDLQRQAHKEAYKFIKHLDTEEQKEIWRRLTTSDHVYYMYTKGMSDGDVHQHFSPYDSPYKAYMYYLNVLNDLAHRIAKKDQKITERPTQLLHKVKS